MRNNIKITLLLVFILVSVLLTSCVTARRVNYLQDLTHGSQIQLENRFEATVAPYDELYITVTSSNATETSLLTPFAPVEGQDATYLVDVNGNIDMPTLGRIHVAGLTRLQLQDTLNNRLKQGGFLTDPFVNVRFKTFKIFFLGSGSGKVLNIPNERCTFLEALAMLGDVDLYTQRDHIAVMREVNGRMVTRFLDPRSSDVFNDPFFMLQQNDFIITQTMNNGKVRNELSYWTNLISMVLSVASLMTSIALYRSIINQ